MSIRKKPDEAVPLLLARLRKAKNNLALQGPRTEGDEVGDDDNETQCLSTMFNDIEEKIKSLRYVVPTIRSWEKKIMDDLCALEKELDGDIFRNPNMKSEVKDRLDHIERMIEGLRKSFSKVDLRTPTRSFSLMDPPTEDMHHNQKVCHEWEDRGIEDKLLESSTLLSFFQSFHCLGSSQVQMCSLCLSVFPLYSVIDKKPLVYWWMGEGLVVKSQDKTAEEVGEEVFQELLSQGYIRPSSDKRPLSVNSFIVDPWIHRMLISMVRESSFLDWTPCNGKRREFLSQSYLMRNGEREEDLLTVFNVKQQYLRMKPEWLAKLKKVEVLQLGRWQHSVDHHIEVENQTLLNGLGSQKRLKYLSLRGISRIETLPPSISKLISLQILDLRACHNLEKLPRAVSRLKDLTHLDVSGCYLLESMPKGLEQLHALQVVKGFVIGKADKTSCKISDLARLNELRKLSIRVGETEKQDNEQLGNLRALSALRILTISWGDTSLDQGKPVPLPPNLTKLDLQCVPFYRVPEWLWPRMLPSTLEKLYIKGGNLTNLEHEDKEHNWEVKVIRLNYLKGLETVREDALKQLFPKYIHLEKIISPGNPGNIILDR